MEMFKIMGKIHEFKKNILDNNYSYGTGVTVFTDDRLSMTLDKKGIYKPEVIKEEESFEKDKKLAAVEPMMNDSLNEGEIAEELYANVKNIAYDKKLGYFLDLYAGYVSEGDYREKASSGGMGTWIIKELFENDMIDGVIHVVKDEDKSSPTLFKYGISSSLEEIKNGAKTKYYPVELSNVLKEVKQKPGRYALVGLPPHIFSVRLLAKIDPDINRSIKYTVGLICGHLKSSNFTDYLAWQAGIEPGTISHIDYRKKLLDRPSNEYGIEVTGLVDGVEKTVVTPVKEVFGYSWGQGFFKVNASDFTDDVMNETADITIGDAWLPEYINDSKGTSVILVRNPHMATLIRDAIKEDRLSMNEITKEKMIESQASHFRHTQDELAYRLWKKDQKNEWHPKKRINASKDIPKIRRKIQDQREIIAKESHNSFLAALEKKDLDIFYKKMKPIYKKYRNLYIKLSAKDLGVLGFVKRTILEFKYRTRKFFNKEATRER